MNAGFWVYAWGGLFDSRSAEEHAYMHVVNLPGLDGGTLCGLPRFGGKDSGVPGGAWRPTAEQYAKDAGMGDGKPGIVCPRCADRMLRRLAILLAAAVPFVKYAGVDFPHDWPEAMGEDGFKLFQALEQAVLDNQPEETKT